MLIFSAFLFFGCRQESLYADQELQSNSAVSKNYVINDAEIKKDVQLWSKLSGIQTSLLGSDPKAKNNDPLLEGAVIMTDYAGVVEKNGITTYTFQIKRIYPSTDTENLVVRKNADGSYSGLLIQYHLSKQEIHAFQNATKPEDIKGKISVYKLNDININSNNKGSGYTYSEYIGCLVVNYEVVPCTSSDQHTNPNQCALTGVDAPQIILMSVDDTHCNPSGNQGGSGTGSNPGGTQGGGGSGAGSTTPAEFLYNTFLFTDFGDAYNICAAGDSQCEANRQLNIELQAYLLTLPPKTSMVSSYLHTFLTIKSYFSLNGGTSFLTERLNLIAGWYNNPANAGIPYTERDKFVNWGLTFLLQNPDVSWTQFENWFLEDIPNNFLQKIVLENPMTILDYETLSSPNFKMRKIDQLKYPNFTALVKSLKTEIQNNPATLNRLVELSGLTEQQVLANLTFGQGPNIRLVPNLTGPSGPNYGNFNPADPTYINVNLDFVLGLEQSSLSSTRHATAFLLAVTILHEFIHFGNYVTGYDTQGNEMGNLFEISTYGIIITHYNAGYYIIQLK